MARHERAKTVNTFEAVSDALLRVPEGNRILGQALMSGLKRLRRMARTYVELSERAAIAKLRTWC